jgi:hypothetical protein
MLLTLLLLCHSLQDTIISLINQFTEKKGKFGIAGESPVAVWLAGHW